jgi:hypothetical protein
MMPRSPSLISVIDGQIGTKEQKMASLTGLGPENALDHVVSRQPLNGAQTIEIGGEIPGELFPRLQDATTLRTRERSH